MLVERDLRAKGIERKELGREAFLGKVRGRVRGRGRVRVRVRVRVRCRVRLG